MPKKLDFLTLHERWTLDGDMTQFFRDDPDDPGIVEFHMGGATGHEDHPDGSPQTVHAPTKKTMADHIKEKDTLSSGAWALVNKNILSATEEKSALSIAKASGMQLGDAYDVIDEMYAKGLLTKVESGDMDKYILSGGYEKRIEKLRPNIYNQVEAVAERFGLTDEDAMVMSLLYSSDKKTHKGREVISRKLAEVFGKQMDYSEVDASLNRLMNEGFVSAKGDEQTFGWVFGFTDKNEFESAYEVNMPDLSDAWKNGEPVFVDSPEFAAMRDGFEKGYLKKDGSEYTNYQLSGQYYVENAYIDDYVRMKEEFRNDTAAVARYSMSAHQNMNAALRMGFDVESNMSDIDSVRRYINEMPALKEDAMLYRSAIMDKVKQANTYNALNMKAANPNLEMTFSDKGFLSTSASEMKAKEFNGVNNSEPKNFGVFFSILAPKGTKAAPITYFSNYPEEVEFLFRDNTPFKVHGVKVEENYYGQNTFYVYMEALND